MKQWSPSFERNKDVILSVLRDVLPATGTVLEIGSGTGQHAAYFAAHLPHLIWQPSDLEHNLPSIRAWGDEARLANLSAPMELNLLAQTRPVFSAQAIVCINTVHIAPWQAVEKLFAIAREVLSAGGVLYVYGAYRYADRPLEPSNETFDQWLKERDPLSGIRDFAAVNGLAERHQFVLVEDRPMPSNNRAIFWRLTK